MVQKSVLKNTLWINTKESNEKEFFIDTQNFTEGVYYIKLLGKEKTYTKKLILKK